MLPLGFWLPNTYATLGAASAAIISILSKVGIYTVLRLWLLMFGEHAGDSEGFGGAWLLIGGLLTIAFGSVAVLATQSRSEEHTSELQSLMRISYAVFCLKKKKNEC